MEEKEGEKQAEGAKNSSFSCTYESESKFPLDTDFQQPLLCAGFNRGNWPVNYKKRGAGKGREVHSKELSGTQEDLRGGEVEPESKRVSRGEAVERELLLRGNPIHREGTERGSTVCSKRVLSSSE